MLTSAKIRYLIVGAACAGLHNAIMIAGDHAGLHYVATTSISFAVVAAVGYGLHCCFTFAERLSLRSFARYAGAISANYPLNLASMFVLHDLAHLPMDVAAPTATGALIAWNYLASRWAIVGDSAGLRADGKDSR